MVTTTAPVDVVSGLVPRVRTLGQVAFVGAVTGVVFGGVGGRVAMLVLRLTSDGSLRGFRTDDGFTIGVVSTETLFLLGVTTGLGLMAALVYAVGRGWFPLAARPWVAAAFFGSVGAAGIIGTGGVDFRILEPLGLALAMFIAIPTLAGFVMAWWIERWLASDRPAGSTIRSSWPLVAFVALGPIGLAMFMVLLAGLWVASSVSWLGVAWRWPVVTWVGRGLVVAGTAWGALGLIDDVTTILGR